MDHFLASLVAEGLHLIGIICIKLLLGGTGGQGIGISGFCHFCAVLCPHLLLSALVGILLTNGLPALLTGIGVDHRRTLPLQHDLFGRGPGY